MASMRGLATAVRGVRGVAWRNDMLYTLALVLVVLWILGMVTSYTAGGLIHILLVIAVLAILFQVISGRRVG